jgi:hypothetical protein
LKNFQAGFVGEAHKDFRILAIHKNCRSR